MSARSRRRRDTRPAPAPTRPAPHGLHPIAIAAIVIAAIAASIWLIRANRPAVATRLEDPAAVAESLRIAEQRKDWESTLRFAETLGRLRPLNSAVYLARGTAWSNYAVAQRSGRVFERPALRTSLERSAAIARSMALTDSAGIVARTPEQWIDATKHLAELEETIGLPGDALLAQESIKEKQPGNLDAMLRAYWLRAVLYDPVHPDTSAWDRRMRMLGRR
jgi:hypothetical protein